MSKSQATKSFMHLVDWMLVYSRVNSQYYVWHKAATHSWHWPGNQVGKGSKEGQGTWREMAEWGYAEVGLISWRRYTAAKKRDKWKQLISIKFAVKYEPIFSPGWNDALWIQSNFTHEHNTVPPASLINPLHSCEWSLWLKNIPSNDQLFYK